MNAPVTMLLKFSESNGIHGSALKCLRPRYEQATECIPSLCARSFVPCVWLALDPANAKTKHLFAFVVSFLIRTHVEITHV